MTFNLFEIVLCDLSKNHENEKSESFLARSFLSTDVTQFMGKQGILPQYLVYLVSKKSQDIEVLLNVSYQIKMLSIISTGY